MESFPSASRRPMADTVVCDSDEEVYFGPVTSKELQKASQLKRRTEFYFPAFAWEQRNSTPMRGAKTSTTKSVDSFQASNDQENLSLSADSLEGQSFVTSKEKSDSSKGEYSTACSQNSLDSNSQTPLNFAIICSNITDGTVEKNQLDCNDKESHDEFGDSLEMCSGKSEYSNVSQDSLEGKRKLSLNVARTPSELSGDLSEVSSRSDAIKLNACMSQLHHLNSNQSTTDCSSFKSADGLTATYEVLPGTAGNDTYTVEDKSHEPLEKSIDLPNVVSVDKDGGFLSILSEAALYHASKQKDSDNTQTTQAMSNDSSCTTQSLEDKFKVFGFNAADLEEQQLSSSIMYTTGRESNVFFTREEGAGRISSSESNHNKLIAMEDSFERNCVLQRPGSMPSHGNGEVQIIHSDSSCTEINEYKSVNHNGLDGPVGSSGSDFQCSTQQDAHPVVNLDSSDENEPLSFDNNGSDADCGSEVSGICPLASATENLSSNSVQSFKDGEQSMNDSSSAEEMNDTLEEYEMMMRYGVEYILGNKGNMKKDDLLSKDFVEGVCVFEDVPKPKEVHKDSEASRINPSSCKPQNSKSVTALCGAHPSPIGKGKSQGMAKLTETNNGQVRSPLMKPMSANTPLKSSQETAPRTPKGHAPKNPLSSSSKVPRVVSRMPVKMSQSPYPQNCKQPSLPVTPSGSKLGSFKKPVTPTVTTSRIPKTYTTSQKMNQKVLEKIQSPVGAYIHNSPSPVLVTNVKAKSSDQASFEKEMHARALWRAGEVKSSIPKPGTFQMYNTENINPNIGCGLPAIKYTRAPCIKLGENVKPTLPRVGEKISKLLDSPSPQVIKHEGRLRVNCGSPQLAAKVHCLSDTMDDSMVDVHSVSGDISVCVSKQASRTDTLGQ